jgi:hypothetical protein
MIIKNYKELCAILEIKIASRKQKILQLKELERYVSYHKNGNKFIIDEIYNIPKEKINNTNHYMAQYSNLLINEKEYNKIGVYCVIQDNKIYIGSTIVGFRQRFQEHNKRNDDVLPTYDMLHNNGYFKILWIANNETEPEIRAKENEYINKYKNDDNWIVMNNNNAWSYTEPKPRYKRIKILKSNYEKAIQLLKDNNLI